VFGSQSPLYTEEQLWLHAPQGWQDPCEPKDEALAT
jgi:hypothetical protein